MYRCTKMIRHLITHGCGQETSFPTTNQTGGVRFLCPSIQSQQYKCLSLYIATHHVDFVAFLFAGVYTGYNTLNIALSLPDDGVVVACDISEEYTNIGKPFWKEVWLTLMIPCQSIVNVVGFDTWHIILLYYSHTAKHWSLQRIFMLHR